MHDIALCHVTGFNYRATELRYTALASEPRHKRLLDAFLARDLTLVWHLFGATVWLQTGKKFGTGLAPISRRFHTSPSWVLKSNRLSRKSL